MLKLVQNPPITYQLGNPAWFCFSVYSWVPGNERAVVLVRIKHEYKVHCQYSNYPACATNTNPSTSTEPPYTLLFVRAL